MRSPTSASTSSSTRSRSFCQRCGPSPVSTLMARAFGLALATRRMYLRRPASSISASSLMGRTVAGIRPSRSSFILTSLHPSASAFLHELDEDAVGPLGIDKSDQGPAGPRFWPGVEQLESAGVRIVKGGGHIVDFEREVMRAFAMLGEKGAELGTLVERLQQLDGCGPFSEKRDSQ